MKKSQLKGNICLLIAAILWGTTFVAQSAGTDVVDPFTYLASRSYIGCIVLIPVIFFMDSLKKKSGSYRKADKAEKRLLIKGGVLCGIVLCAASGFQQFGMWLDASAGDAGFITALYILIVPVAGLFFGKKVGAKVWIGVAIALLGLYLLTEKFSFNAGTLMVLICAFAFSAHIMVVDYFSPKVDGVRLSCIQFFVTAILATVLMFIFEKPSFSAIIDAAIPILYAGVMSSGIAYTLQIVGQKYTDPTVASMLMSLESVFALLSGMIIQPEQNPFKLIKIMGCAAIFAAIIIAQLPDRKKGEKV
ncbi:MAG: DMT family transporter [Clostridia bacterium]|nr:DMT family transporter [Clostridia bacterium]